MTCNLQVTSLYLFFLTFPKSEIIRRASQMARHSNAPMGACGPATWRSAPLGSFGGVSITRFHGRNRVIDREQGSHSWDRDPPCGVKPSTRRPLRSQTHGEIRPSRKKTARLTTRTLLLCGSSGELCWLLRTSVLKVGSLKGCGSQVSIGYDSIRSAIVYMSGRVETE